ncbi:MAG: WD40 repeat domain-containing protein [Chitinophagaceae bacterium]
MSQHKKELWTVRFNPDGSLVASADVDGAIKIWKKDDGTVVHDLKQLSGITSLAFSPDGYYLVTASYERKDKALGFGTW